MGAVVVLLFGIAGTLSYWYLLGIAFSFCAALSLDKEKRERRQSWGKEGELFAQYQSRADVLHL